MNNLAGNTPVGLLHQLSNDIIQTGLAEDIVAWVCTAPEIETDWRSTQAGNHLNQTNGTESVSHDLQNLLSNRLILLYHIGPTHAWISTFGSSRRLSSVYA